MGERPVVCVPETSTNPMPMMIERRTERRMVAPSPDGAPDPLARVRAILRAAKIKAVGASPRHG
jgi:hypothetical protein